MFDNLWLNFNSEFTAAFCGHAYLRTTLFYQKRDTKKKKKCNRRYQTPPRSGAAPR